MNDTIIFWSASIALTLLFLFFVFHEYRSMRTIESGHPERGFYWFNVFFFFCTACVALFVGYIIQEDRLQLMAYVPEYPHGRYAVERGKFFDSANWVYVSPDDMNAVSAFYQNYARARGWDTILGRGGDVVRISFILPDGNFFLTLRREDSQTVLYFSTQGEVRVIPVSQSVTE